MNIAILQTDVQQFINQNLRTEITKLVLKGSPFKDIKVQELEQPLEGKRKAKGKLPPRINLAILYASILSFFVLPP